VIIITHWVLFYVQIFRKGECRSFLINNIKSVVHSIFISINFLECFTRFLDCYLHQNFICFHCHHIYRMLFMFCLLHTSRSLTCIRPIKKLSYGARFNGFALLIRCSLSLQSVPDGISEYSNKYCLDLRQGSVLKCTQEINLRLGSVL